MSEILQVLTDALSQSPIMAVLAAFIWGICGVIFSPCHLAGIPLIIAYVHQQETRSSRRAVVLSSFFALGMLLMIVLLGFITVLAGRTIGDSGSIGYYVVSVVFILIGLDLLDAISLPWFGAHKEQIKAKGILGAVLLGLVFGLASGPCTFAFLAPILAVTFQSASSDASFSTALLLSFGIGHGSIIILAGASADRTNRLVEWNRKTKTARRVRMFFGVLLVLGGLYFLYRAI